MCADIDFCNTTLRKKSVTEKCSMQSDVAGPARCLGPHGGPRGGGLFLMNEVPIHTQSQTIQRLQSHAVNQETIPGITLDGPCVASTNVSAMHAPLRIT